MRSIIAALILSVFAAPQAFAEQIWLTMDQVRPYKLDVPASSIVVGNPGIADVTVRDENNLFLFGKAPGLTNIYIFDEEGEPVRNLMIRVRTASSGMLVFHRGAQRTTYNCTSQCEPTITVGDSPEQFSGVSAQVEAKASQAANAASQSR
ncbi:MAG: pilus assembly protein N-terminal domain-containing protein [Parvularculaceae bacterium]